MKVSDHQQSGRRTERYVAPGSSRRVGEWSLRAFAVNLPRRGETQEFDFKVSPSTLKEGKAQIRAVLEAGGKSYSEGYSTVSREDLDTFYYYQPAAQRVSVVDVKVPKDLKVGYVMGAGDDIPTVLKQMGMDVTVISAENLATKI